MNMWYEVRRVHVKLVGFFKSQPLHDKRRFQALFGVHATVINEAPVHSRLRF